jgi:hypothetical protein
MGSKMKAGVSRRSFLTNLATGAIALGTLEVANTPSLYAANDGEHGLLPDYLNGILVEANEGEMRVVVPGRAIPPVLVKLTAKTQICKGSCESTWEVFRMHDRVECSTHLDDSGIRVSEWVNVNPIYSWATVDRVEGSLVHVKHVPAMPFMSGPDRALQIDSYTHVTSSDREAYGVADFLESGSMVYYTGCANDPDLQTGLVMAILVYQTGYVV